MKRCACVPGLLVLVLICARVSAGPKAASPAAAKEVDVSTIKEKLQVWHDGKGHYLVGASPKTVSSASEYLFYGDGKTFYRQWVQGSSQSHGDYSFTVVEPRVVRPAESSFDARGGKFAFTCRERDTPLELLAKDKALPLLSQAKFYDVHWQRKAHALARDSTGRYYYVDRLITDDRAGEPRRGFRVFSGMRGAMRQLRMKNVVSDVKGEIFITAGGELRLVLERSGERYDSAVWIQGKRSQRLVPIPVDDGRTRVMIYRELGVYSGLRLERPCDDW